MYPFERFTEQAKKALALAQEEAEASGHAYIGTEHLLLGLMRVDDGLAYKALATLGVQIETVRQKIDDLLDRREGQERPAQVRPTARVKKAIELSFEEARRRGYDHVGSQYLLLGLLMEGDNLAARALADLGVALDNARTEVDHLVEGGEEELARAPRKRLDPAELSISPAIDGLLQLARLEAARTGSRAVGEEHVLGAIAGSAGIDLLDSWVRLLRLAHQKEEAIQVQDFETAASIRTEEKRTREEMQEAMAAWRTKLLEPRGKEQPA
jgi:ATP-dependent Clp protease ATP-binding subunit ClpA